MSKVIDATDRLREMLDECGVKWSESFYPNSRFTRWKSRGVVWNACNLNDGILINSNDPITPENVIAATMDTGTLTAEQVRECVKEVYFEGYSDGATHRANGIEETDWQAIADKLNATLGVKTCQIENAKLRNLVDGLTWCYDHYYCRQECPLYDMSESDPCREVSIKRELGIEV